MALDLSSLNEAQRKAVTTPPGPLLVFAGAGSGKTRVLTYRLAYLIESGMAEPWQILAVTFTNKAAGEMKRRVEQLLVGDASEAWVHTFHSACLRILRQEAQHVGLQRDFVIYDQRDQQDLLKRVLKELDTSRKESPARILSRIERAKRSRVDPSDSQACRGAGLVGVQWQAYGEYQRRLRESNAVDFTDLLVLAVELFEGNPDVLSRYQRRFRHLLVDEFQDTDELQYRLVQMLALPDNSVCAVGDDDQSIYSFRGADVGNIRGFADDYPDATEVCLDQNYRSTTAILDAASRLVNSGGGGRQPKQLWTERGEGEPLQLETARDEADEARRVAYQVQQAIARGLSPDKIAVLYRTNAQSRSMEESFQQAGIPFVLIGGMRFYERREVKEILSYLRLLVQPADTVSFARAVRAPTRGIGPATVLKVLGVAARRGLAVEEALGAAVDERAVGTAVGKKLIAFSELLSSLREEADTLSLDELVARVVERSGLARHYLDDGSHEGQQRVENLEEFVRSCAERQMSGGLDGVRQLLDQTALVADTDKLADGAGTDQPGGGEAQPAAKVNLMTIHCAKGLEFSLVCLVGLDEGIFPNSRAAGNQSGLEEEFRLAYVACTRAEDRLCLFRARRRFMVVDRGGGAYQGWRPTRPSPFLRFLISQPDLPAAAPPGPAPPQVDHHDDHVVGVYEPSEDMPFQPGMRVRHPSFGIGEVRRVEGTGAQLKLTVFFRREGMRKLYAHWANLEILGSN